MAAYTFSQHTPTQLCSMTHQSSKRVTLKVHGLAERLSGAAISLCKAKATAPGQVRWLMPADAPVPISIAANRKPVIAEARGYETWSAEQITECAAVRRRWSISDGCSQSAFRGSAQYSCRSKIEFEEKR
jgi:hypothetical protein